jgi:hypothetical protein
MNHQVCMENPTMNKKKPEYLKIILLRCMVKRSLR